MDEKNNNARAQAATQQDAAAKEKDANIFPLDDACIEMLTELAAQARTLDVSRNAVLTYFAKQHKLQGNWQLAENGRELVRAGAPLKQFPPNLE
jgi:hypothetical protein